MHTLVLLLWGLAAGAAHAFEVDHMTAVSTFVAKRPTPAKAVLFGVKWALGHGLSLLLLGSILFALKATLHITMSETLAGSLERVVGMALFGLGLWTLLRLGSSQLQTVAGHSHAHSHDGTHTHSHGNDSEDGHSHPHAHDHGSLWMGVLHGLAGTAGFVGEGVVALSQSYTFVVAYTLVFSLGVLIAMSFYAGILGGAISWGGRRSHRFLDFARGFSGFCACVVGLMWMFNWKPFSH